jgi:HEAT repeat protein
MPRFSPKASKLVKELRRPPGSASEASLWKRLRSTDWRLGILRELAETGEANVALAVLDEYLGHDLPTTTIAEMLDALASRATVETLIGLERERAQPGCWYDGPHWPAIWEKLERFRHTPGGWAAFAIASLSRSGYLRERSVRALDRAVTDGREILFLVLRTADHVPQVRQAATSALASRITPANGAALVRALPLTMHLRQFRRHGEPTASEPILRFLTSPEGWPVLSAGLHASDARVRRESFALAFSAGEHRSEVVQLALRSGDPLVRLWGVRQSAIEPAPLDDLLAAARYPFTPVRAAALERLSLVDPAVAASEWKRALLDSSPSIRALARRRLLAETTSLDLRAFYRYALAGTEPTSLAPAIAGLAEVGRAEDAAEIILLTNHPRAKVREAVAAALARLLGMEAIDALTPMLTDQSPRVARKAAQVLTRHLTAPLGRRVWAIVQEEAPEKGIASLRLLARLPQWEALDYLLRGLTRPEPLHTEALALLQHWYARFHRKAAQRELSTNDAARLRNMLTAAPADLLPREMLREIDFSLEFWLREGR